MPSSEPSMQGVLREEITKVAADLGLQGSAQLAQTKKMETLVTNMNSKVTRLTDVVNQMHRNYTSWRFWTVGNRHAGEGRRPFRPYCKPIFP